MPYKIEFSPNNRATCMDSHCKAEKLKVLKGEVRFGTWVEIPNFDSQSWKYKHWGCVTPKQIANLGKFVEGKFDRFLEGYDQMPEEWQEKVRRACEQGYVDDEDWRGDLEFNRPGRSGTRSRKHAKGEDTEESNIKDEHNDGSSADHHGLDSTTPMDSPVSQSFKKRKSAVKEEHESNEMDQEVDAPLKPKPKRKSKKTQVKSEEQENDNALGQDDVKPNGEFKNTHIKSEDQDKDHKLEQDKKKPKRKPRKAATKANKFKTEDMDHDHDEASQQSDQAQDVKPKRKSRKVLPKSEGKDQSNDEVNQQLDEPQDVKPKRKSGKVLPKSENNDEDDNVRTDVLEDTKPKSKSKKAESKPKPTKATESKPKSKSRAKAKLDASDGEASHVNANANAPEPPVEETHEENLHHNQRRSGRKTKTTNYREY